MAEKTFLLLLWAPTAALDAPRSGAQARASRERFHLWSQSLRDGGHLVDAGQLQSTGDCVTRDGVREGTMGGDHTAGGWFVIRAESREQAIELARACPLVAVGGTVEVRPLMGG